MKDQFMRMAIWEANEALEKGEYPAGVVIVKEGKVVSTGFPEVRRENIAGLHGEVAAIRNACKKLQTRHLVGCELYTTVEPCIMCTINAKHARIGKIFFGAKLREQKKRTADILKFMEIDNLKIEGGFLEKECDQLLEKWYKEVKKD